MPSTSPKSKRGQGLCSGLLTPCPAFCHTPQPARVERCWVPLGLLQQHELPASLKEPGLGQARARPPSGKCRACPTKKHRSNSLSRQGGSTVQGTEATRGVGLPSSWGSCSGTQAPNLAEAQLQRVDP